MKSSSLKTKDGLVVLLIDMQDDFINDFDRKRKKEIIPNQSLILELCRDESIPLIVIEFSGHGRTTQKLLRIINAIPKANCKTITKRFDNAFCETNLEDTLKELNAKTLLIMGINACACVYETAEDAVSMGYEIITSEDLIAGFCESCLRENGGRRTWYGENTVYLKDNRHVLDRLRLNGALSV